MPPAPVWPYAVGDAILVENGRELHEAKVLQLGDGQTEGEDVYVHYAGWNKKWDSWARLEHTRPDTADGRAEQASRARQLEQEQEDARKRRKQREVTGSGTFHWQPPAAPCPLSPLPSSPVWRCAVLRLLSSTQTHTPSAVRYTAAIQAILSAFRELTAPRGDVVCLIDSTERQKQDVLPAIGAGAQAVAAHTEASDEQDTDEEEEKESQEQVQMLVFATSRYRILQLQHAQRATLLNVVQQQLSEALKRASEMTTESDEWKRRYELSAAEERRLRDENAEYSKRLLDVVRIASGAISSAR